jgi:hypothetical protein
MHKKLLSILALSVLVASTLAGCGQPYTLTMASTSGGDVSVMKEGAASWMEAEVGMSLEPGDVIKSGDDSGAEITFLDGSTIELEAGTEIEVVSLDISTETDSSTIGVKQTIGKMIFRVTKIVGPASHYEVETPAGVIAVRGSAVQITVLEDGTTWACNLEGDIWAIAQGVELQIPEGQCCFISAGQPPKLTSDLTISSTTGGSVTSPGEGTFSYDEGTVVDLVAEAEEGYRFVNWSGDVSAAGNASVATTTITMDGDKTVTATFAQDMYTLTVNTIGSGSVGLNPTGGSYPSGTVVTLTATAGTGWRFSGWSGDLNGADNPNAVTIDGDKIATAIFTEDTYTLTVSTVGTGSVSVNPAGGSYPSGTVVTLTATASPGWTFSGWSGDLNGTLSPKVITMEGNKVVVASFEVIGVTCPTISPTTRQYNLDSPADVGTTITWGSASSVVSIVDGDSHTLTGTEYAVTPITPGVSASLTIRSSYLSEKLTGSGDSIVLTVGFDVGADATFTITAVSEVPPVQYNLTMAVTGSGSTSPAVGQHTYAPGTLIPVIATPALGYQFVNWTATAGSFTNASSPTTTFTMPSTNVIVTANFALIPPIQYSLTMAATGSGSTSPAVGQHIYSPGTVVAVVATPALGYQFGNWTATAGSFADAGAPTTTFTMPAQNVTVTANFAPIPPIFRHLTVYSSAGGLVTTPGEGIFVYDPGTVVTLVATPDSGYYFVNWSGDVGTIADVNAAVTTITMSGTYSITANFAVI